MFYEEKVVLSAKEYDKNKEGVDYTKGTVHAITSTHSVLATDEEYAKWMKHADEKVD